MDLRGRGSLKGHRAQCKTQVNVGFEFKPPYSDLAQQGPAGAQDATVGETGVNSRKPPRASELPGELFTLGSWVDADRTPLCFPQ